jgi:hypothetical protein
MTSYLRKRNLYTKTQVEELIHNITGNKMSVPQAARHVNIKYSTALDYYKHFKKTGVLPTPRPPGYTPRRKIQPHHVIFITQQIDHQPFIAKKKLFEKLNDFFPELNLAYNTFETYVRNNLVEYYQNQKRKMISNRLS